jgi:hypothetical protein
MTIWLLDSGDWSSHGKAVEDIVRAVSPKVQIKRIKFPKHLSVSNIIDSLLFVNSCAKKGDIILITWTIPRNDQIDSIIKSLSKKYRIICSAGNSKQHVENFTPANLDNTVEVIHCLKKSGENASFTNFGASTIGMYGTNITVNGLKRSGTTISAAIYAALVSRNSNPKFVERVKSMMQKRFYKEMHG